MAIDYDHAQNAHTLEGARAALPVLIEGLRPRSLLDVGCGAGVWMRAALDLGIADVWGIDGIALPPEQIHVPRDRIVIADLAGDWNMHRSFDLLLCLEVAEHLDREAAPGFIERLTRHSETVILSAANVWQRGQHHVNGQWPAYWQELFNQCGFACRDSLRWKIWENQRIEAWYRQNVFMARRAPAEAGKEPRIPAVVHPDALPGMFENWRRTRECFVVAKLNDGFEWLRKRRGCCASRKEGSAVP